MIRYHLISIDKSIQVRRRNLTAVHARRLKRLLAQRYPDKQFRAIPSDAWNRIINYLEKL